MGSEMCIRDRDAVINKPSVDSFLATSSREFKNEDLKTTRFTNCLWIDTTGKKWGSNAEEAIRNQIPPVTRLNLNDLKEAKAVSYTHLTLPTSDLV